MWLDTPHLDSAALLTRLQISSGTCPVGETDTRFEPGARIAREPWQAANIDELTAAGVRLGRGEPHETVALVQVPSSTIMRLRTARALSRRPGHKTQAATALARAMRSLWSALPEAAQWFGQETERMDIGFSATAAGSGNTTVNHDSGRLVGLHFDSWDRLPPLQRWKGHNRICINLGAGRRALQFVPMQSATIVDALRRRGVDVLVDREALRDSSGRLDLARRFLEVCPKAPVLRLMIHPGEAYIAPTENLIHDGAVEHEAEDLTLTARGMIVPLGRSA